MAESGGIALNQCRECRMSFSTHEEFVNHREKFCLASGFADATSLADKLRSEPADSAPAPPSFEDVRRYLRQRDAETGLGGGGGVGGTTLGDLRRQLPASELRRELTAAREREKADEVRALVERQKRARMQRATQADDIKELIRELEQTKQAELQERLEREQVSKALKHIDGDSLTALEADRQNELASLSKEKEVLRQKQQALEQHISSLEAGIEEREAEARRQTDELDQLVARRSEPTSEEAIRAEQRQKRQELAQRRGEAAAAARKAQADLADQRAAVEARLGELRPSEGAGAGAAATEAQGDDALSSIVDSVSLGLEAQQRRVAQLRTEQQEQALQARRARRAEDVEAAQLRPADAGDNGKLPFAMEAEGFLEEWLAQDSRAVARGKRVEEAPAVAAPLTVAREELDRMAAPAAPAAPSAPGTPVPVPVPVPVDSPDPPKPPRRRQRTPLPPGRGAVEAALRRELFALRQDYQQSGEYDPVVEGQISALEREIALQQESQGAAQQPQYAAPPQYAAQPQQPQPQPQQDVMSQFMMWQQQQMFQQQMYQQQMAMQQAEAENQRLAQEVEAMAAQRDQSRAEQQQQEFQRAMHTLEAKMASAFSAGPGLDDEPLLGPGVGVGPAPAGFDGLMPPMDEVQPGGGGFWTEHEEHLRAVSQLPKDSPLYDLQMRHLESMAKLRFEHDQLIQERKVEAMRRELEQARLEGKREQEHEAWMAEQKRQLLAARMRRQLAKEQLPSAAGDPGVAAPAAHGHLREYNPEDGFELRWDFVLGVPAKAGRRLQLVFGIFDGATPKTAARALEPSECEPDTTSGAGAGADMQRCVFVGKTGFAHVAVSASLRLSIELQQEVAPAAGPGGRPKMRSLAWTILELFPFNRQGQPRLAAGFFKLPLHRAPRAVPAAMGPLPLPGYAHPTLYVRVCHAADSAAFDQLAVNPDVTRGQYEYPPGTAGVSAPPPQQAPSATPTPAPAPAPAPAAAEAQPKHKSPTPQATPAGTPTPPPGPATPTPPANPTPTPDPPSKTALRVSAVEVPLTTTTATPAQGVLHVRAVDDAGDPVEGAAWSTPSAAIENGKYKFDAELPVGAVLSRFAVELRAEGSTDAVLWGKLERGEDGPVEVELREPPVDLDADPPASSAVKARATVEFCAPKAEDKAEDKAEGQEEKKEKEAQDEKKGDDGDEEEGEAAEDDGTPAFVKAGPHEPPDTAFARADGFDVYVDGCRFLPYNVTVSQVVSRVFAGGAPIGGPEASQAEVAAVDSPSLSPRFGLRQEFRGLDWALGSTLLLRFNTVSSVTKELVVLGYAALDVFRAREGEGGEDELRLNEGCFQLPLVFDAPDPQGISEAWAAAQPQIQCASVLVRVVRAPAGGDGKALCAGDVPEAQRAAKGLQVPPPAYDAAGRWDSSRCADNEFTARLFPDLQKRRAPLVKDALKKIDKEGVQLPPADAPDDEVAEFMEHVLSEQTRMMWRPGFATRYSSRAGFKVAVDGLARLKPKKNACYVVLTHVFPPGSFFAEPQMTDQTVFTHRPDWESRVQFPHFLDGFQRLVASAEDEEPLIVFDVRLVTPNKPTAALSTVHWAAMPLYAARGFVNHGGFQLPLLKGAVPYQRLFSAADDDSASVDLAAFAREDGYASIFVRVLDDRADPAGVLPHFDADADPTDVSPVYLPKVKMDKYLVTRAQEGKGKRLRECLPRGTDAAAFGDALEERVESTLFS